MQVHTRLYRADVQELKKRARDLGLPWQVLLRKIVHEALLKEGKIA
jgi:predicted DNA binding CopG/RHH family protein